ncbi:MAG: cation transporter [Ruthenibacterium sp.]
MGNKPDRKDAFEAQQRLMVVKLMGELPNFICLIIAAVVSKSILICVDLIDSFNIMLRTVFVFFLSGKLKKDLSYRYNYGTGKVEALASLCCDMLLLMNLAGVTIFAVHDIVHPQQPDKLLFLVILLKLSNVSFDVYVLLRQKKNRMDSKLYRSELAANFKDFLFDGTLLIVLVIANWLRDAQWTWYISPICALALVVAIGCATGLRMRRAVIELMDVTCDEKIQLDILKVLVLLYDQYDEFLEVKSRPSGNQLLVDIYLRFHPETTYEQIAQFTKTASTKLQGMNPDIVLSIVIREE